MTAQTVVSVQVFADGTRFRKTCVGLNLESHETGLAVRGGAAVAGRAGGMARRADCVVHVPVRWAERSDASAARKLESDGTREAVAGRSSRTGAARSMARNAGTCLKELSGRA